MDNRRSPQVYSVMFHPPESESWLVGARHRDLRLTMAACMADIVGLMDGGGLLAFAAGFLQAPSVEAAGRLADQMLAISRDARVAMVFGVDIGPEREWAPLAGPPESLLFACDGGRRLWWPLRQAGRLATAPDPADPRVVSLCGFRVGVLMDAEVFNAALHRQLEHDRPAVLLVMTHLGPKPRWKPALQGLSASAPLVITGESSAGSEPVWCAAPPGWQREALGGTPSLTLYRYRPDPFLTASGAVEGGASLAFAER
jgi:hypothetical protein